jgi:chromosome partitioning protein
VLSRRIGFRVAPGFGERVIYRELFPAGLTVLDLPQPGFDIPLSMSHLAARQEVRALVSTLTLPFRETTLHAQSAA